MDEITTGDRVLEFIETFMAEKQYSPTVREIMHGVGMKSTNTADYWKKKLRKEGIITYQPGISRSIVVLNGPAINS